MRGVFAGSGVAGMQEPIIADTILSLALKSKGYDDSDDNVIVKRRDVVVMYIGTATYDIEEFFDKQTVRYREKGCRVINLKCTSSVPVSMTEDVKAADIILVSGGNTLFAVDRWKRIGLDKLLEEAVSRGAVMAGGSAGAICWFDGGHSDSNDPASYRRTMLAAQEGASDAAGNQDCAPLKAEAWEYIRIPALGFLPGLVCPHFDQSQSNGVLRSQDFDNMMLRHGGERGIGIDHWSALVIDHLHYHVISLPAKPAALHSDGKGSVLPDGRVSSARDGLPGVWIKDVVDGKVQSCAIPPSGNICDILKQASVIVQDPNVAACRLANPDDAP